MCPRSHLTTALMAAWGLPAVMGMQSVTAAEDRTEGKGQPVPRTTAGGVFVLAHVPQGFLLPGLSCQSPPGYHPSVSPLAH